MRRQTAVLAACLTATTLHAQRAEFEVATIKLSPPDQMTSPMVIQQVRPNYTSDAMRARIQGPVLLECVVRPNGSCSDIKLLQSLDSIFGLDVEAIKAARQWRFQPGTRRGLPVPVSVKIELDFRLR